MALYSLPQYPDVPRPTALLWRLWKRRCVTARHRPVGGVGRRAALAAGTLPHWVGYVIGRVGGVSAEAGDPR